MREISDIVLLKKIAEANERAFYDLYNKYWQKLYSHAYGIIKDRQEAEDVVQEVFMAIWAKGSELNNVKNVSAYLITSARNKAISLYNENSISDQEFSEFSHYLTINDTEDTLNFSELNEKVSNLMKRLPEKCRKIFYLSRIENLSHKEISEKLGIRPQTVKNQISKALVFIKANLSDE